MVRILSIPSIREEDPAAGITTEQMGTPLPFLWANRFQIPANRFTFLPEKRDHPVPFCPRFSPSILVQRRIYARFHILIGTALGQYDL